MGGSDKGLLLLDGRPMIEHVIDALVPQLDALMISANRNLERYRSYGYPVISDADEDYRGPLAGIAGALARTDSDFLLSAPCDAPFVPGDLVSRLRAVLDEQAAELAVVDTGDRLQPVFMLLSATLLPSLNRFLDGGGRKIDAWFADHHLAAADFTDRAADFTNINTPEEKRRAEQRLRNG
jgi:molybdenum cofactor guanylyltransferase